MVSLGELSRGVRRAGGKLDAQVRGATGSRIGGASEEAPARDPDSGMEAIIAAVDTGSCGAVGLASQLGSRRHPRT
eukprot:5390013-Pyramimonas_sp.AAC.1